MFLSIFLLILGFIFLIKGADILVDGSSSIARKFGISTFVIGLTIVAFGTSAPELVISALASIQGKAGIALGNIIGSNISNTLLILGASALVCPLLVKRATVTKEIPLSLLAVLAVGFMVNDQLIDGNGLSALTRIDGLILILFFVIFIYYTFGIAKVKDDGVIKKTMSKLTEGRKEYSNLKAGVMIIAGLAGLALGGHWIVNSAVFIAQFFGVSEILIGLTIVAIGTSLPELAASVVAARKGSTDLAIGNVVGSNIFNMLWVLGVSSSIRPINYNPVMNTDILILISITILLLFLIFIGKRNVLDKKEGMVMLSLYVGYLLFLILRG